MAHGVAVTQFADRRDAGRRLAAQLGRYGGREDVVVLGLPRGGVPVAYEVALALSAPLDVLLVRKLGVPGQEELAFGAIASGGVRVLNADVVFQARLTHEQIEARTAAQQRELERRERLYRAGAAARELRGQTAIVVDDGLATGATMRAAIEAVHERAGRAVVAVPVGAAATRTGISDRAEEVVCLLTPARFLAVGHWYGDFDATSDEEVCELLALADARG